MKKIIIGIMALNSISAFAWTKAGKLEWSEVLPNKYSNCHLKRDSGNSPVLNYGQTSCYSDRKKVKKSRVMEVFLSEAKDACDELGGRLPSISEFTSLTKDERLALGVDSGIYWSSSIYYGIDGNYYASEARAFFPGLQTMFPVLTGLSQDDSKHLVDSTGTPRNYEYNVICVRP